MLHQPVCSVVSEQLPGYFTAVRGTPQIDSSLTAAAPGPGLAGGVEVEWAPSPGLRVVAARWQCYHGVWVGEAIPSLGGPVVCRRHGGAGGQAPEGSLSVADSGVPVLHRGFLPVLKLQFKCLQFHKESKSKCM